MSENDAEYLESMKICNKITDHRTIDEIPVGEWNASRLNREIRIAVDGCAVRKHTALSLGLGL